MNSPMVFTIYGIIYKEKKITCCQFTGGDFWLIKKSRCQCTGYARDYVDITQKVKVIDKYGPNNKQLSYPYLMVPMMSLFSAMIPLISW